MKIKVDDYDRNFECVLHFLIHIDDELVAVSFAGPGTSAHSIPNSIVAGRKTIVTDDNDHVIKTFYPPRHNFTFSTGKAGDAHHCVIISKDATLEAESKSPVILAPDGGIARAVGEYLVQRFPVPDEYAQDYIKILDYKEGEIIRDVNMDTWKDLKVIQVQSVKQASGLGLTEQHLLEGIKAAQERGMLRIPRKEIAGNFDPSWTMKEYLRANAATLSAQVRSIKPRHNPETDKLDPAIAQMDRIPFPAQAHVIQAIVNALAAQNMAIACGDMGSGKSIISLGVCNVLQKKLNRGTSVLYCGPGIVIPKMHKKEIVETLPEAKVQVIRNTNDALQLLRKIKGGHKPQGIEFVLVGIDRAKLGPDPYCSAVWRRISGTKHYAWHCPDCGQPTMEPKSTEDYLDWHDMIQNKKPEQFKNLLPNGLPRTFSPQWKLPAKVKKCPECGASLWRPALKSRGETKNKPRWFVSFVLRRLKKHFDLFIMDEVHQTKASDSGRGDAFTQLLKASRKTLCLTGTMVNGMSTSIKELLWRTDPRSLIREGFNYRSGTVAWAKKYGVLERTYRSSDEDEGIVTRRKKNEIQPRERPGIAPELVANHLLHRAAFLELGDLGLPLVELDEIPVFIKLDDEHKELYGNFHKKLHTTCVKAYMEDKCRGAFGKFIPATINYGDVPNLGAKVEISNKSGKVLYTVEAPKLDYFHAKERELVGLVQENLAENRGCIIYCNYTDSYSVHRRLKDVLEVYGIEASVLESRVSPERRIEWLAQKEEEGARVIICNMRLVEVGLDLLPWPTTIFYQLNYDINTVRQASKRGWRIGQTRECRIYYLIYDGTQQADQFKVCMLKRAHALLAEGRLDRSELSRFGRDGHTSLAADIASCLLDEEAAVKWKELARKDLDEDVELVRESEFAEVLSRAQKKLARETLELCGFAPTEIEDAIGDVLVKKRPTVFELAVFLPKKKKRKRKPKLPGQLPLFDVI